MRHQVTYALLVFMVFLKLGEFGCCAGVRTIAFAPDGCCLLAAAQDGLTAWAWEPVGQIDTVEVPWAKVHFRPGCALAANVASSVHWLVPFHSSKSKTYVSGCAECGLSTQMCNGIVIFLVTHHQSMTKFPGVSRATADDCPAQQGPGQVSS